MTPADCESVESGASLDTPATYTTPTEDSQVSVLLNEVSTVSVILETARVESNGEEENEMVEMLEDLILEAYHNIQIDGECIFLPDEVAAKLHRVADQIKLQESSEEQQTENHTSAIDRKGSEDAVASEAEMEEANVLQQEISRDRLEPEPEKEQEQVEKANKVSVQNERGNTSVNETTEVDMVQALHAETAVLHEEQHKRRLPRVMSTESVFTELPSVPEVDESVSSGPPSPSPMLSRSLSGTNIPKPRTLTFSHGHGPSSPPPLVSTPSSAAASPNHIGKPTVSRTLDQSIGTKRKSTVLTYEKRKEAALKLKEDKKKRDLLVRETARKQREDSKRKLEEAHQREMEKKIERVRRIREERLHRRAGTPTGIKGTKKKG